MTSEEAIRIAQGLITDFKCESETMVEFCNVVIKALKKEPCEDAISRQEFIIRYREWGYSEYGHIIGDDALAIRVAKSLPPVNPQ